MKKPYQHPVTRELPITGEVSLLAGSYFKEVEPEPGAGINPGTQTGTGLSRKSNSVFDSDFDSDYDF